MSRPGKIARLPRALRETLNGRLHEGEPGPALVAWLNAEPAVQAVLAEHFGSRPINVQNLSDWRQGGYADWCRQQQILELAERLREERAELDEATGGELDACLAQASTLALMRELKATWGMEEGPDRLKAVLAIVRALDRSQRAQLDTERAQREARRHDEEVRETKMADPARLRAEQEERRAFDEDAAGRGQPPPDRPPASPVEDAVAAIMAAALKLETGTPDEQAAAAAALEEAARGVWHPPHALQAA